MESISGSAVPLAMFPVSGKKTTLLEFDAYMVHLMLNEYEGKGHEDPSGPKVNDVDRFANSLLSVQCPETPGH